MVGLGSDLELKLLIVGNIAPLISVVFFGADLWFLLLLYWLENFLAGGFNALMIMTARGGNLLSRTLLAGFFTAHYGVFVFVHLFFLLTFIGGERPFLPYLIDNASLLAINAIMLSLSYLWEYISKWWPSRNILPELLMSAPYGRIVVLQLTIILGAFTAASLGSSVGFLAVLIVIRTLVDVFIYLKSRVPK